MQTNQLGSEGTLRYDKQLRPVFPSSQVSVWGTSEEAYNNDVAHQFKLKNCLGFHEGQTVYDDTFQEIQFVQKNEDGTMIPGLQSEQLLRALIARHKSMNAKFPSREGSLAITHMEAALLFLQERIAERMDRGVMGQLAK
ncbi:hypothetical protein [Chitinophaga sp. MM2321]|uniref:hypothetical protein n=1 Tax=Chitinophaga sp. MM2321 TaxID=3137178 RepID=UPI0032D58A46